VTPLAAPTIEQVRDAARRVSPDAAHTPLLRFEGDAGDPEIFLKLECLQPIGSFKLRGALNRMRSTSPQALADGVYTASAGNMAQGVAWAARALGIPASVIVPDSAPQAKRDAIQRLGARLVSVPYEEWWAAMRDKGRDGMRGLFIHPFADTDVMAGNGTIALEILDALPDVDTILVPWGGGGLTCGIAAAARVVRPDIRVYAVEVEGAAPLTAAFAADKPVTIENRRTFVDGIGGPGVFAEMWPLARALVSGTLVVSLADVAAAVTLLTRRAHVVAEGAGAAALAAARTVLRAKRSDARRVACVISGGNIDAKVLVTILSGGLP
jgi:threonine dehydratase